MYIKKNLPTTAIGSVSEINGHQLKMHLADIQCRQIFVEENRGEMKGERSEKRVAGLDAQTQGLLESDWDH